MSSNISDKLTIAANDNLLCNNDQLNITKSDDMSAPNQSLPSSSSSNADLQISYKSESTLTPTMPINANNDSKCEQTFDNRSNLKLQKLGQTIVSDSERETWNKKVDFLLSVIGFAVDLSNVWRFPYLCFKNGGGAFLIPYLIMLAVGGIPLFFMELALGQYHRKGAITCWGRIVPLFKGVGYSVVLIAFYVDFYYNVIIAWALHYFFASFTTELPWTRCNNLWNTEDCYEILGDEPIVIDNISQTTLFPQTLSTIYSNNTKSHKKKVSAAFEYFNRGFLQIHKSSGINNLGSVRLEIALSLFVVYLICYFSLWKGISTSAHFKYKGELMVLTMYVCLLTFAMLTIMQRYNVVWFTALFPYVVLFILLIRGIMLPGSLDGIKYYLTPDFNALYNANVWVDAATQVFFSLGPGFGVLLAFASYNEFHNNVHRDALLTSAVNSATSFLAGFVIFAVLGHMAHRMKVEVKDVAAEGPGLVFIVYPEAIATMPAGPVWAVIFFLMLLTLGLDSSFGGSEAIITALSDEYPIIKRNREIFVAILFSLYFVVGIASCTQGGAYIVNLLDRFAAGYSILFAVLFEAISVSWIYGVRRFSKDIKSMLGFEISNWWKFCWGFVAPFFIMFIIIYGLVNFEPLKYGDYEYPTWANIVGLCIAASSVLSIPCLAIWQIIRSTGTLKQRIKKLITPWQDSHQVNELLAATSYIIKNNETKYTQPTNV